MTRTIAAGAAVLLFLTALLGAQTPRNSCSDCKGTGYAACKKKECKPALHCGIPGEHKCDALFSAKCCRGLQKTLCPKCKDPILEVDMQAEVEARIAWVERMRKYDDACNTRFSHVETDHWLVHCSFPEWKVGDTVLSRSRAAHLMAERLEKMTLKLEEILGGKSPKHEAFLVWTAEEMMRTTLSQQGIGQTNLPFKTYGNTGKFTVRPLPGGGGSDLGTKTDENFHPHLLHTGAHLVTQSVHGYVQQFAPWIDEPISHWIEIEGFKKQATFCFREVNNNKDPWRSNDWKKQMWGEVGSKKEEPFAKLITFVDDKLAPRDKAHCWSWVDYMIKSKPGAFAVFFKELKATNDTKKALEKAYGMSTAAFHDKWREWVLKTYGS